MEYLIIIVAAALIFDFINGFHDAANSIATVVSTKVLSPFQAVIWAAAFNFLAFWIFDLHVADTVSKTVQTSAIDLHVIFAGLLGAIIWNLVTWWYGIPSSSSHTLIGGFAGAAVEHAGFGVIKIDKVAPVMMFIVLAPLIGMLISVLISVFMLNVCRNVSPFKTDKYFRKLQLISAAAYSLGHGGNDAQKVMGIITAALVVQGIVPDIQHMPTWVAIACYSAISLGTLSGGWRIVRTMGNKITKLTPFDGVAAEGAGAITLFTTGYLGIPVSTTHTITGSIIGVGLSRRFSAVRWGITVKSVWAWIITIPISAALAAIAHKIIRSII